MYKWIKLPQLLVDLDSQANIKVIYNLESLCYHKTEI